MLQRAVSLLLVAFFGITAQVYVMDCAFAQDEHFKNRDFRPYSTQANFTKRTHTRKSKPIQKELQSSNQPLSDKHLPIHRIMDPEAKREAQELAIQHFVHTIELAARDIEDPDEFIKIFLAEQTRSEQEFLRKRLPAVAAVYRSGKTALTISSLSHSITIDFKEIFENKIYFNGQAWILKHDQPIQMQWPLLSRKIDLLMKDSSERKNYSMLERIISLMIPSSYAVRKGEFLKRTPAFIETAAKKAEAKKRSQDIEMLTYKIEVLEKQIAKQAKTSWLKEIGKGAVMGTAVGIATAPAKIFEVIGVDSFVDSMCKKFALTNPSCAQAQWLKDRVSESPSLDGGASEEDAIKAARLFNLSDIKCGTNSPNDPIQMTVEFKTPKGQPNVYTYATLYYDEKGTAQSGSLVDSKDRSVVLATYKFSEGKLKSACIALSKAEIEAAQKETGLPTNTEKCVKDSSVDADRDYFELHRLLTRMIDLSKKKCAAETFEALAKKEAPNAPAAVPSLKTQ